MRFNVDTDQMNVAQLEAGIDEMKAELASLLKARDLRLLERIKFWANEAKVFGLVRTCVRYRRVECCNLYEAKQYIERCVAICDPSSDFNTKPIPEAYVGRPWW